MPAIVDHEPKGGGAPLAIFESGAIMMYIAEKAGPGVSPSARYYPPKTCAAPAYEHTSSCRRDCAQV
jgi:glutathione S-transferase